MLTGGSINTPKLLLLSGIGDEPELAKFPQIKHVASVPGVGMHLQDHPKVSIEERGEGGAGTKDQGKLKTAREGNNI